MPDSEADVRVSQRKP